MSQREPDTLRGLITRMAQTRHGATFLLSPETKEEATFAELHRHSERLAQHLLSRGLSKGDKVAFMMDNGLFTAKLFLGAMYGGFVAVPLNARAGSCHLAYTLDHCDAKAVFVSDDYLPVMTKIRGEVGREIEVIPADLDRGPAWEETACAEKPLPEVQPDDDALLIYTSGSTGRPKGAVFSHNKVLESGWNSVSAHELSERDRSLCLLPLYHINAETVTLVPTLLTGGSVVMPHRFLVRSFWDWITEYRCTWSALVPTIISQLLDWIDPRAEGMGEALQQIRFLRSSSAPLAPSLHQAFEEKFKLLLIEAMGSTECGGNIFSNPLPPGKDKIGTPGLPFGFEAKVVNPEGVEVARGEPGEIVLRGPSIMNGYYKGPQETAAVLGPDGWLRTGDLACIDEDGYYFIVGRAKELIIKGGMNIAPRQIDEALEAHPGVLEAAAVGVPDHYFGEEVVAFAVPRCGARVTEQDLLDCCESRLGRFKTPSRVHIVSELPKGPSGKVQRLRLTECFKELLQAAPGAAGNGVAANGLPRSGPIAFEAPRTPIEEMIAETWAEVLDAEKVGAHDNFFGLGGHSLLAIDTLSRLRKQFAVEVSVNDFFTNPTVAQQAVLVSERLFRDGAAVGEPGSGDAAAGGRAALEQALHVRRGAGSCRCSVPPRDRSLPCPLSPAQERLWFLETLNPGLRAYNEPEAARLCGPLNVRFLEDALNVVVARHEALRTLIRVQGETLVQVVQEAWTVHIALEDLAGLAPEARESEVKRLLVEEPRRPFDLAVTPGIRALLVRCGPEEHVFILTLHHMVCDGWSLAVLYHELAAAYRASCMGEPLDLGPAPLQYPDFAAWKQRQVDEGAYVKELAFWTDYLRGAPASLELPTRAPRPERFTYEGEKRTYPLGQHVAEGLRRLSRREEVSLFTVLTAAFNLLLGRYAGHDDVVLGVPIANRDRPELLSLFGFLIDFQALRTNLSGNPTFRELLGRVRKGLLDVNAHRGVPFNRVVEALNPPRDLSRAPVFQTMLVWKDRQVQMQFMELEGLTASHIAAHPGISKFDLTVWLTDVDDDIWAEVEYCTDLFSVEMIQQFMEAFQVLLKAIVAEPEACLDSLPVLTSTARRRLLVEWNDTAVDYPRDVCVHELFEAQARRTPGDVALIANDRRLTYSELNARADKAAHYLRAQGVGPGMLVGICLERSPDMVAALLAVLKAGAAYVPLDPDFPSGRLADMVSDAEPAVIVTQSALLDRLPRHEARVILLDAAVAADAGGARPAQLKAGPEDPAYVLYTSGSTGRTKGVVVPHRAVVNLLTSMARAPGMSADDVLVAVTTLSFDIAALELFLPLTVGGRVVLASREVAADGPRLAKLVDRSKATVMQATPATWRMLIEAGWRGDGRLKALCGGEALSPALAEALLTRCGSLWNVYGPTETTIWSTCERIEAVDEERITIGRPIANTRTYILDAQGRPTPPGVAGELYIGGAGVACGYLNRPELTAERFMPDAFADEPGARMYRTGDRARHLPGGRIEFLGRLDNQVKVRGFRIELGEIEAVLERHPAVRQAVAVVNPGADGGQLAAYVVARETAPSAAALREHLRTRLPDYMIPTAFVMMDDLPLTPNGKVDRRALPAPEHGRLDSAAEYVPPRTVVERQLAAIWSELLGEAKVGVHDNFFDIGGHSLLAVRLFAKIEKTFGRRLPLAMLFKGATIEHLARKLQKPVDAGYRTEILAIQPQGSKPPLFFLPSLVGEVMYCNHVARHLGPDQPVYGIQLCCGDGTTKPLSSLEAIAGRCVEDLCAFQTEEPYRLAGYSFAGMLAFEMARQLSAQGREVDLVAIIDTGATRIGNGASGHVLRNAFGFLRNLPYWVVDDFLKTRPKDLVARFHRLIRAVRNGRGATYSSLSSSNGLELEDLFDIGQACNGYRQLMEANLQAFQEYTPGPYPGRITLLRARARPLFHSHEADLGWSKFARGGVEIKRVPGNHSSILQEPIVRTLAAQLKSGLNQYEAWIASRSTQQESALEPAHLLG